MSATRTSRGLVLMHDAVQIVLYSQVGANHLKKKMPCQDACMAAQQFYKGYPYTLLAVADGHGSASYTRSEMGAHLAVQAVQSAATRFIPYIVELLEEQPADWRRNAQHEFKNYFGRWLRDEWEKLVVWHLKEKSQENSAISGDTLKSYGTTLAILLLFENLVFVGAIGDSVIYFLQTGDIPDVSRAFPEDPSLLGLQAHSLCSPDAHYKWETRTVNFDDLGMIFLGTDGFSDSLENPEDSVKDIYDKVNQSCPICRTLI
jgi:serine/threonine protein phosphatase PrpC